MLPAQSGARRAGFTLVEVIVVLVILAILAAIAIPALTGYIDKARESEVKSRARELLVASQTLLSEAYANPQEIISGKVHLYVDGTKIAILEPQGDLYYVRWQGNLTNSYVWSDGTNKGSHITGANTASSTAGIVPLLWKLTNIPGMNYEYATAGNQGLTIPNGTCYVNNKLQILSYVYLDPYSWTFNDDGSLKDTYAYVYNIKFTDNQTIVTSNVNIVDTNAGYTMWKYVFPSGGTLYSGTMHSL
jgi:prepilin-type N-terminal cleavage/methylation domain-containing protein